MTDTQHVHLTPTDQRVTSKMKGQPTWDDTINVTKEVTAVVDKN